MLGLVAKNSELVVTRDPISYSLSLISDVDDSPVRYPL